MLWTESRVGVEGAQKISESLMKNSTLTSLYLSSDRWSVMIENYIKLKKTSYKKKKKNEKKTILEQKEQRW